MTFPLPEKFLQSLQDAPGFDKADFVEAHQVKSPLTSIRLNPQKLLKSTDYLQVRSQVPWCSSGRYLTTRPSFTLDPVFHGGAYYVQEASSMFLEHILKNIYSENLAPSRVLDLCAAPGGKSTLLAAALPQSLVVANEVIKTRVPVLSENISKWGSGNVIVTNNDPKDFQRLTGHFDLIVIDAPCSGSGLFRKDEAAMDEWSEANVQLCSMRQQRIISDVIDSLKQDGYFIYSTCSYSVQEDEAICDWIMEQFHLEPVQISVDSSWGITESYSEKYKVPCYRFYPDKVEGEGFFVACFRQVNPVNEFYGYETKLAAINKQDKQVADIFLKDPEAYILTDHKEIIIASPKKWEAEIATINKTMNLRKSGIAVGEIKGKDLIPHHELTLSGLLHDSIPVVELDKEEALRYLRRQDLNKEISCKGWTICRHEDINLGWMKVLPNRLNNYYPLHWRILKQ